MYFPCYTCSYSTTVKCINPPSAVVNPFSAVVKCSEQYQSGESIYCQFDITNHHCVDYHVLKWHTPLEGMTSKYLSVTRDDRALPYDGMLVKWGNPSAREYLLIRAGTTVSSIIDISLAYAMNVTGLYTVQLKTNLKYHRETHDTDFMNTQLHKQTLESTLATFQLIGGGAPKKTMGEHVRQHASTSITKRNAGVGLPPDPRFVGGTAAERALTKEIHRTSYHYISAAEDDIDDNQAHYISWFGVVDAGRIQQVKQNFHDMQNSLEQEIYTYHFNDPRCIPNVYAFTFPDVQDIYLCDKYGHSENVLGVDTKLCTIVHELSHAVSHTEDHVDGRQDCLDLATNDPAMAISNGDNYCYFAETTNIFDYGFDSIARLPNKRTYVTRGNVYIRYSDSSASTINGGYPALLKGSWGDLPDNFHAGFDSMVTLPNGKIYVTKGSQYVRYSDSSAITLDSGYPAQLLFSWGNLPADFSTGFDSAAVLPNDKTYVTSGNQYIRYSDNNAISVDSGYPSSLQGNWGNLPTSFADGFDSMALLGNGKTYVTKSKQYIRYSDSSGTEIDPGYPVPIKGNWGTIHFPGPQ